MWLVARALGSTAVGDPGVEGERAGGSPALRGAWLGPGHPHLLLLLCLGQRALKALQVTLQVTQLPL